MNTTILFLISKLEFHLVNEPIREMEQSHHTSPVNAILKDAPGHSHKDILSAVCLHSADETVREKKLSVMGFPNSLTI